jgi:four helix bundle protein
LDSFLCNSVSIGANYRKANRAESKSDFLHKISVVAKEASESEFWLLLLKELYPNISEISQILIEARELLCIFDKIRATMRNKDKQ